jgi:hypothetical protein
MMRSGVRAEAALVGLLFLAAHLTGVQGICYLEDANAKCTVCWKTVYSSADDKSGFTTMSECPTGLSVEYLQPPPLEMFEGQVYKAEYAVNIDLNKYPVVAKSTKKDGLKEVPHANVHSCIASRGACTPFVSNSPGLATHTPALVEDVDDNGHSKFLSDVKLTQESYVIIAHVRFFTPNKDNAALPAVKYDMAVGVVRDVKEEVVAVSSDSYVLAGTVGGIVLVISGSLIYVARTGMLDVDKIVEILFSDHVTLAIDIIGGISDVLAFTLAIIFSVSTTKDLIQILPLCWVFCALAWLSSIYVAYEDLEQLYRIIIETWYHDLHVQKMAVRHANDSFVRRQSAPNSPISRASSPPRSPLGATRVGSLDLWAMAGPPAEAKAEIRKLSAEFQDMAAAEDNLRVMHEYEMAKRNFARMRRTLLAMVTETIPITVLSTYIVVVGGSTIITTMGLIMATLILGAKATSLADYKQTRIRKEEAQRKFDELFNKDVFKPEHPIVVIGDSKSSGNGSEGGDSSTTDAVPSAKVEGGFSKAGNSGIPKVDPVMPVFLEPTPRDANGGMVGPAQVGYAQQGTAPVYPVTVQPNRQLPDAPTAGSAQGTATPTPAPAEATVRGPAWN